MLPCPSCLVCWWLDWWRLGVNQSHNASYCYSWFCRVKNCPHKNMVKLGQSSTYHGSGFDRDHDTICFRLQFFTWPNQENKLCMLCLWFLGGGCRGWAWTRPRRSPQPTWIPSARSTASPALTMQGCIKFPTTLYSSPPPFVFNLDFLPHIFSRFCAYIV